MDYFEMERRRYSQGAMGGAGALGIAGGIPPVVRSLIIINLAVFFIQKVLEYFFHINIDYIFGFVPYSFVNYFMGWQIFTYMFLHGGIFHIFFNLLALWMFGGDVERSLGSRQFLKYYIACGVFSGVCSLIFEFNSKVPVIGASGAIFGVLIAFGMLFPERVITLLLFFIIPVRAKAKYFVTAFAILTFFQCFFSTQSGIAYFAHLGGIVLGYAYFKNILSIRSVIEKFPDNIHSLFSSKKIDIEIPCDVYISEEIDPILEKISREGMHSLTRREKKLLKKARDKL